MRILTVFFLVCICAPAAASPASDIEAIAASCTKIDGRDVDLSAHPNEIDNAKASLISAKTDCAKGAFDLLGRIDYQKNNNLIRPEEILNTILTNTPIDTEDAEALAQVILTKKSTPPLKSTNGSDLTGEGCRKIDGIDDSGAPVTGLELRNTKSSCFQTMRILLKDSDYYQNPRIPRPEDVRDINKLVSVDVAEELANLIEEKKAELRAQRNNASSKRFVKRCFNQSGEKPGYQHALNAVFDICRLRASNTPGTVETNKPASFAYTANRDGADSIAVQSAFKGGRTVGETILSASVDYQRNNQQKKEQANLKTGLSVNYILAPSTEKALVQFKQNEITLDEFLDGFYSAELEFDVDYNRTGIFGDPETTLCQQDPAQPFCGRQNLESLRLTGSVAPFLPFLTGRLFDDNDADASWPWAISPVGEVFFDTALNNDVVTPDGNVINGDVFGVKGGFAAAIAPGYLKNRIEFSVSGHVIQTISRDPGRISTIDAYNFERVSRELSASIQYALSDGAFVGQASSNNVIPIISFTYTNGSNSLEGKQSQDTFVVGLGLEY